MCKIVERKIVLNDTENISTHYSLWFDMSRSLQKHFSETFQNFRLKDIEVLPQLIGTRTKALHVRKDYK